MKRNQVYWGHFQLQLNIMLATKIKWLNLLKIPLIEGRFKEQYIKV